jgi:hypothetical protein|uniref:Uncharacterized protein n=1 Tax=Siphoviridae sp. ctK0l2 TaxID=2826243 RepID=A0A8S5NK84_9CAUD|nr:MAG TPA: hypothetical protein [Siphoviridae sp. ctK0l2]
MNDTIEVGMTYDEYLAQIRAEQFGWETEEITSISDSDLTKPAVEPEASVEEVHYEEPVVEGTPVVEEPVPTEEVPEEVEELDEV